MTSSLSVLVAANVNEASGKLKKAAKLGIRTVALDEFLQELGEAKPEPREGQLEFELEP
ncbi:hypothetical protein SDC9_184491 [bioreactor metagenome]|uniref:BRCT domain-containing protein n=1 Tax=bioreactor metagenome TaxID=1076179 RepID=A0A645HFN7_9ZZZZ